jgi:hypothetical protein
MMSTPTLAAPFRTTCSWCIIHRAGRAPNYIFVSVPKSSGICPECAEAMREQIRKRAAAKVPA